MRINRCEAIPAGEYSSGLLFNPSGYQTFYHRSECFQKLAIEERDPVLCDRVRERDSWLFEGWYVSASNCRKLVKARQDADIREFASLDPRSINRLTGLEINRNGNGRDFDLLVTTKGHFPGEYLLEIFFDRPGHSPALLYRETVHGGLLDGTRILLLREEKLREVLGGKVPAGPGFLRSELRLLLTEGNRFFYHRLPINRLSSNLTIPVDFADLPPWQPEPLN